MKYNQYNAVILVKIDCKGDVKITVQNSVQCLYMYALYKVILEIAPL